ncbi:MAG TPA: SAM-dependent chlorinase/fluorinase [Methanotrichaceae archaeon]|nr:SAM-dependent chlorinase/fluorinase [Methanotrichaceae archaeon]
MTVLAILASFSAMAADSAGDEVENLVVLLTDYGTSDFYVGALEGSIYSANPEARISTITHEVLAFNVAEGSYILAQAARYYPPGTVFAAEVDPVVGTVERSIVLETNDSKIFVGPDNGLFTGVMDELGIDCVREITNLNLTGQGRTSATFDGMEIYGPVAGHLAARTDPAEVGPEIFDPVRIEVVEGDLEDGTLIGTVAHVDHWGNLVTNIPKELAEMADLSPGDRVEITVGGENVEAAFATTYGDVPQGEWVAVIGLLGRLEIAINMGSAAEALGVSAGSEVRVHKI